MPSTPSGPAATAPAPDRPRIDPNAIPSPVPQQESDQQIYDETSYMTSLKTNVPRASTDFHCIDDGNSNPRFVRMTCYNIPHSAEQLEESQLPLAMVVQPLAKLRYDETPIPVVDVGESGPIRCEPCRAYMNPNMTFINGGRKFICNICKKESETPADYFANLDMSGKRVDVDQRPELRCGSVEYVASREYIHREPQPISFVFAIDVSYASVQNGMVKSATSAISDFLYGDDSAGLPMGSRMAIITYDKSIHFYNLSSNLEQATMLVVPDLEDIFVPLSEGFLVDPYESRTPVESLLSSLPVMLENNKTAEATLGGVVKAVHSALDGLGGKLTIFQSSMPSYGPGSLNMRDDPKLHGTEKERELYKSAGEGFYVNMAEECVNIGLSVTLYMFPSSFIDVATIGSLATTTAGNLYLYRNFTAEKDGDKFAGDLKYDLSRRIGYNGVMRFRVSEGLRIGDHAGNYFMRNNTDVELAGIDNDTAVMATLRYDGQLDEKFDAFIQIALLYTTSAGERRIRVHNLAVPVTAQIANVFRHADIDVSVNVLTKLAIAEMPGLPLKSIRDQLTNKCVNVLAAYRRHCAPNSQPGQLILPDSFKLFPLFTCSMIKGACLRNSGPSQALEVPVDIRVFNMMILNGMPVAHTIAYYYPRLFSIHNLSPDATVPDHYQRVRLPPMTRASYQRLDPSGVYLLENGDVIRLWIGKNCSVNILDDLFGVKSIDAVPSDKLRELPARDSLLSQQVNTIIDVLRKYRTRYLGFQVVRQERDAWEYDFAALLTEDRQGPEQPSYADHLVGIHGQIRASLTHHAARN
ncbi:hypothetical protein GQ42DRAFT_120009 [Ramicandelaber brevisporus]|nr:hypothetical protein GQ42DRAFT_120009 [Ramicandelaber brevisporus]